MATKFQRGFKTRAMKLALSVRKEMSIGDNVALDPRKLAEHVDVPVLELPDLLAAGMSQTTLRHLTGNGKEEFSAALFERGGQRLIVANPSHSTGRQASNIVHEVSHILLKHIAPAALLVGGCRQWDAVMEGEADWLAGELLVPRNAALEIARSGEDVETAARRLGVSRAMMNWRLNHSGARKQAAREKAARRDR